jgi:hypothetical protein
LKSFREKWGAIHKNHPSQLIGLALIDELLSKDKIAERYVTPLTYEFKRIPTAADVLVDVTDHRHFFHGITMMKEDNVDAMQFMHGWAHMGDNGDPVDHIPYIAMDVQCNSEAGLLGCMQGLPKELCQPGIMVSRTDDGNTFSFTDVITPAFTISRPHQDGCARGQVLLEAYGTKLVVWYDESDEVRTLFTALHTSSKGDYMWSAIANWPGLRWTILTPGKYIIMRTGTIHSVMSSENSAVCGWYFQDKESLLDGSYGKMLNWELDLIEKRIKVVKESEADPSTNLDLIADEMQDWKIWLEKGDLDRESKRELKNLKREIERRIVDLSKRI